MNYETVLKIVVPLVCTGLGYLLSALFKGPTAEKFLAMAVGVVYPLVDKLSQGTPNTVDDKIALALKVLNDYYNGHGKELSPVDTEKAKALFAAMSGAK